MSRDTRDLRQQLLTHYGEMLARLDCEELTAQLAALRANPRPEETASNERQG